ncbi:hypothetical protein ABIC63_000541 [Pseudacidovorax sp. 1753]|uniref:hypothetical protein n=1 Tax=Pseudacidovorax sp. 1753 TaxID=3156419 RepID=UPI003399D2B9
MADWEGKQSMLKRGIQLMEGFCAANDLPVPPVTLTNREGWSFDACAYYRPVEIHICVDKCASIGYAGMQWSFPSHSVDRTPYGVIAHELGHHADWSRSTRKGRYFGDFSIGVRKRSGEAPLTSYCPNDAEWFAEMFRLFVTNPDLLQHLRPRTHADLLQHFKPVLNEPWRARLAGAPDRTILSIERKLTPKAPTQKRPREKRPAQGTLV